MQYSVATTIPLALLYEGIPLTRLWSCSLTWHAVMTFPGSNCSTTAVLPLPLYCMLLPRNVNRIQLVPGPLVVMATRHSCHSWYIHITCHIVDDVVFYSSNQLGYVKINLAEYAGSGDTQRKYLLESYNERVHKPDNSILKVKISLKQTSGDVVFKA